MNIVEQFTDDHLSYWAGYEPQVARFGAPNEEAVGIKPALALITPPREPIDLDAPVVRVAWKPDEIDLAHLARGGTIWLSTVGRLPPHELEVQPPNGEPRQ